jgi:anti-sigma-K factor RskA
MLCCLAAMLLAPLGLALHKRRAEAQASSQTLLQARIGTWKVAASAAVILGTLSMGAHLAFAAHPATAPLHTLCTSKGLITLPD